MSKSLLLASVVSLFLSIGPLRCGTTPYATFVVENEYAEAEIMLELDFEMKWFDTKDLRKVAAGTATEDDVIFDWRIARDTAHSSPTSWPFLKKEQLELGDSSVVIRIPPKHKVNFGFVPYGPENLHIDRLHIWSREKPEEILLAGNVIETFMEGIETGDRDYVIKVD